MRYCVGEGIRASLFARIKLKRVCSQMLLSHTTMGCNIEFTTLALQTKYYFLYRSIFFRVLHVQEEHSHVIAILCCGCFRLYEQLLNMDICVGPLDSQEHKFRYRQKKCLQRNWFLAKEN